MEHRKDIQALRALAVMLVVAAHAKWSLFKGGYVGVDVFFVLSGYLISGLILTEVEQTGRFAALHFYARRMKRLLPGLFLMLAVTALLVTHLNSPWHQRAEIASAKATTLWLSNFFFAAHDVNYFSEGLNTFALLHTWSLGVEEQFYVVWPWIMLFLIAHWSWQGGGGGVNRRRLFIGMLLILVFSMAINLFLTSTSITAGFYLMPSRAWEFALGAIVFLGRRNMANGLYPRISRWAGRSLLNLIGIIAILASAVLYPPSLAYPGAWALVPCLGTALALLDMPAPADKSWLSRNVLAGAYFQFFGNISYSWYLWHWPILLLGTEVFGDSAVVRGALVVVGLVLAIVAYYVVERPLHRMPLRQPLYAWGATAAAILIAFHGIGIWSKRVDVLARSQTQKRLLIAAFSVPVLYDSPCDTWYHSSMLSVCKFGPKDAGNTVVVLGDSVMAQWFPALYKIYVDQRDWRLIVLTKSACAVQDETYYYARIKRTYTVCSTWRQRALRYISKIHPRLVIAGSTLYGFTPEQWIEGTRETINSLSGSSRKVLLFAPAPSLRFNGLECLSEHDVWPTWLAAGRRCSAPEQATTLHRVDGYLKQAISGYSNVSLIVVNKLLCPHGICSAERDGQPEFRDELHITASFASFLTPGLERLLSARNMKQGGGARVRQPVS